ncbi:hypothetical protein Tco_0282915 [Tanacetum coccineum]
MTETSGGQQKRETSEGSEIVRRVARNDAWRRRQLGEEGRWRRAAAEAREREGREREGKGTRSTRLRGGGPRGEEGFEVTTEERSGAEVAEGSGWTAWERVLIERPSRRRAAAECWRREEDSLLKLVRQRGERTRRARKSGVPDGYAEEGKAGTGRPKEGGRRGTEGSREPRSGALTRAYVTGAKKGGRRRMREGNTGGGTHKEEAGGGRRGKTQDAVTGNGLRRAKDRERSAGSLGAERLRGRGRAGGKVSVTGQEAMSQGASDAPREWVRKEGGEKGTKVRQWVQREVGREGRGRDRQLRGDAEEERGEYAGGGEGRRSDPRQQTARKGGVGKKGVYEGGRSHRGETVGRRDRWRNETGGERVRREKGKYRAWKVGEQGTEGASARELEAERGEAEEEMRWSGAGARRRHKRRARVRVRKKRRGGEVSGREGEERGGQERESTESGGGRRAGQRDGGRGALCTWREGEHEVGGRRGDERRGGDRRRHEPGRRKNSD